MNEKTLRVVIGAVVALVVLYAVVAMTGRGSSGPASDGDGRALVAALEAAGESGAELIRIVGPADSMELTPGETGWRVNGRPADEGAVRRLLDALAEARVSHLASDNPENHGRLGVTPDAGWRLEVRHPGGKTRKFVIGNSGPSHPSTYVRLDEGTEVYVVRGDLGFATRRGLHEWRDRVIVRTDTSAVREVEVTRDGATYTFVRGDEGWTLDDKPADAGKIRDMLAELARLEAVGFVESDDGDAPDVGTVAAKAVREVVARDGEGRVLAHVRMAEAGESGSMHTVAEGPAAGQPDVVFELSTWRADRLAPALTRAQE